MPRGREDGRRPPLPESLAYLKPVVEQFDSFAPEALGDDNPEAMAVVETAVRRRVHGMPEPDVRDTIERDLKTLEQWIVQEGHSGSVNYLYGALLGTIAWASFWEPPEEGRCEGSGPRSE